ncbi:Crp/Fnr family transcriptional regulator [Paracoccaceae bacterium GXU_MW_L88]
MCLSEDETTQLRKLQENGRLCTSGCDLVTEGDKDAKAFILISGWAYSYKILPDGARQIVDFHVPGDFLGLRNLAIRYADYSIAPICEAHVGELRRQDMTKLMLANPKIATAVLWSAARDEAVLCEHLTSVGRRQAVTRTAHIMLELWERLRRVGQASDDGFHCPLTQTILSDALGLTSIHLNRCLRKLREMKLLTFKEGRVHFEDLPALISFANFDDCYLDG